MKKFYYLVLFSSLSILGLQFFESKNFIFTGRDISHVKMNLISIPLSEDWVKLSNLPPETISTLVKIEDKRFFQHKGFSLKDIHSALFKYFFLNRKLRGASTITQQLARTLFLTREKTLDRKIKEIKISVDLEKEFSKEKILEFYMNTVYWGHGNYGLSAASSYYFQMPAEELNIAQIRSLIEILKKPDTYDADDFPEKSLDDD